MKAFLNRLLWAITIVLFLINSLIIITYNILCYIYRNNQSTLYEAPENQILWVLLLTAFIVIVMALMNRNTKWNQGFKVSRIILTVLMGISLCFLLSDGKSISNDYVLNDIVDTDRKEAVENYSVITPLLRTNNESLPISDNTYEVLKTLTEFKKHEGLIIDSWEKLVGIREIIESLDSYSSFNCQNPDKNINFNSPQLNFRLLRSVSSIYRAYTLLMVDHGKSGEGIKQLCQLHRVARRGYTGAVTLVNKMCWQQILNNNIQTAYEIIARKGSLDPVDIGRLINGFKPLTLEEISLKNVFIGEYLIMKNYCYSNIRASNFIDSFDMISLDESKTGVLRQFFSGIIFYLSFKPNLTVRDIRSYSDIYIDTSESHPVKVGSASNYIEKYYTNPNIRNMAGWVFVYITHINYEEYINKVSRVKVKSDMLAIAGHKRLEQQIDIYSYYTGENYTFNQTGTTLSTSGPDGIFGSDDDINLECRL